MTLVSDNDTITINTATATPIPPDRGSGFLPILIRILGGITYMATRTARASDNYLPEEREADRQAILELVEQMVFPAGLSTTGELTVAAIRNNVRYTASASLADTFSLVASLAAELDHELLGLTESRGGTTP